MVQTADFGKLHDLALRGAFDGPEVGCVFVEREMGARLIAIGEVAGQDAVEVSLAENEHVIQALAPDRADEPPREGVLPGAVGRGMSRETVRSTMSIPSFRSFPWMRGASHMGFAAAIFLTRAMRPALTGGRPAVERPDS
jgi:hypothetical protein